MALLGNATHQQALCLSLSGIVTLGDPLKDTFPHNACALLTFVCNIHRVTNRQHYPSDWVLNLVDLEISCYCFYQPASNHQSVSKDCKHLYLRCSALPLQLQCFDFSNALQHIWAYTQIGVLLDHGHAIKSVAH